MSPDDPPKKPPRASWEPPDADEAPATKTDALAEKSGKTKAPWTPPPVEPLPPKKPRAQAKPPRASWETPDPDEAIPKPAATSVSGSWSTESSVVVAPASDADTAPSGAAAAGPLSGSPGSSLSGPSGSSGSPGSPGSSGSSSSGSSSGLSGSSLSGPSSGSSGSASQSGYASSGTSGTSGSATSGSSGYASSGPSGSPSPGSSDAYSSSGGAVTGAADVYSSSGAYAQPESSAPGASDVYSSSGAYAQPEADVSGSYASSGTPESGSYAGYSQSGSYAAPSSDLSGTTSGTVTSASGTTSGAVARPADNDDPMAPLPTVAEDNNLRAAVGAKLVSERKRPPPPPTFDDDDLDEDDDDRPKGSGRGKWIAIFAALVGVLGLGIGALVIFGNINKQRFAIACEPQEVHATQGRGFPPWGERSIDDEGMWKPIKIPPEAECRERETEDQEELSRWYLEILVERASSLLTAREVTKIDDAAAMLDQALLHARSPDRREQRRDIERLLGDVGYWRASAKLKDASTALVDAAKQFDAAAAQRPRHVSDASAWAAYVRKLAEELKAGPNGALTAFPPTPPVTPGREPAPPGVALPVEPPAAGSGRAEPPAAPPDAGLPTGGVLL